MARKHDEPATPWTRLEGSLILIEARTSYAAAGLAYHNFAHVLRLYCHAASLGFPYDPALDHAILTHDVVMDGRTPERSSAAWLDAAAMAYGAPLTQRQRSGVCRSRRNRRTGRRRRHGAEAGAP